MKLLSWTLGSRWFWATLLVAGTVGAVELDRRGIAPWNEPPVDESLVAAPTVDLGEAGDFASIGEPGAFDGLDATPVDLVGGTDVPVDSGFGLDENLVAGTGRGFDTGFDGGDFGTGDLGTDDFGTVDDFGRGGDAFDFDTFDRVSPSSAEQPVGRPLRDPFPREPAPRTGPDAARDRVDPPVDSTIDSPNSVVEERFELRERLDRLERLDDGERFDPLASPPGETVAPDAAGRPPLDPATAHELPLERVDGGRSRTKVDKPAREAAPPVVQQLLEIELDVTAPLRMTAGGGAKFELVVRNPGDRPLENVVLTAQLDDGLALPGRPARGARKQFGTLAGGETRKLGLAVEALAVGGPSGADRRCVQFAVEANGLETVQKRICVEVREPVVRLEVTGPQRRRVGERGEFEVTIVNDSDRALEDVRLKIDHPTVLVPRAASQGAVRGAGQLEWSLDRIAPGETVTLQAAFDCSKSGPACLNVALAARDVPGETQRFCVTVE
jgi:hypothetical protein